MDLKKNKQQKQTKNTKKIKTKTQLLTLLAYRDIISRCVEVDNMLRVYGKFKVKKTILNMY